VRVAEIAGLELWVGNARQTASYLTHAYGFEQIGDDSRGPDQVSYELEQGGVRLRVTGATDRDAPVASFVRRHGDGVRDIVLSVHDPDGRAPVPAFGETVHTLVGLAPTPSVGELVGSGAPVGLLAIDHVAISVEPGQRTACVDRYERDLGFEALGPPRVDIDVGESAFTMSSVQARDGSATLVFAEPADGPSQIADFLRENGGPGVHHVAFATGDIVATAAALRARGVGTLQVPAGYYQQARERFRDHDLPWEELERLGILVDRDDDGLLLQAFTDPIGDRPTLYFEIIQRMGATGFGTENVRALYHAVVLDRPGP
jgi:4-hydroxyphenylpyruvate dioxygenase